MKPRRRRKWERHFAKERPLGNSNVKRPNFVLSGERTPQRLIF